MVVREREAGRLVLLRLSGGTVLERRTVVESGAGFAPPPRAEAGRCVIAHFVPDDRRPTLGSVRVTGGGSVLGWRGTEPLGLGLTGDANLTLAAWDPDWPDRVDLWLLRATDGTCATPEPGLMFEHAPWRTALGAILPVSTPTGDYLVTGGLTAPGETALVAVR